MEGKKLDRQKLDYRRGNGREKMKKNRKWRSIAKGEAKGKLIISEIEVYMEMCE